MIMKLNIKKIPSMEDRFKEALNNNDIEQIKKLFLIILTDIYPIGYNIDYFVKIVHISYPQYIDLINKYLILL